MLNIAINAARKAGNVILRALDHLDTIQIDEKSANNFVTEVDKQAESEILYVIRKAYPSHSILAEESGAMDGNGQNDQGKEFQWIIDPLDGTNNFIHGFPHFAVSIALKQNNRLQYGVIYDPVRDDLFTASRGAGAHLNNRRMRVSNQNKINKALLSTDFPPHAHESMESYIQCFSNLMSQTSAIRRTGSAALDLAYVAAGRLDGYWEPSLQAWDIAAGALMVKEAGGYVTDFDGKDNYLDNGNIIAANPKIYPHLYQHLHKVLKLS